MLPDRIVSIKKYLACPECKGPLTESSSAFECEDCKKEYPVKKGKIHFIASEPDEAITNSIDKLKYKLKSFSRLYYFIVFTISPVMPIINFGRKFTNQLTGFSLNLGSGNYRLNEKTINIDMFPYEKVDIVCDATSLPFKTGTVDNVISSSFLEHVPNPQKVVKDVHRVLVSEGKIISMIPFMAPYHASPGDYSRYTIEGIENLHEGFVTVDKGVANGPTSALLWVLQEWLSLVLSFGIRPLKNLLYFVIMILTFPLKTLDLILAHFPGAENIAINFYYIGKKKEG